MIILGTIERYLITVKSRFLACFRNSRGLLAFAMLCLATLLRGTSFFEIQVSNLLLHMHSIGHIIFKLLL